MVRTVSLLCALAVGVACGGPKQFHEAISGIGGPCGDTDDCRKPLGCVTQICLPTGEVLLGEACGVSADCDSGYCAKGTCAPAGDKKEGDICTSSAECDSELVCAFIGFGGTCDPASTIGPGSTGDIGDHCTSAMDCYPALVCDPTEDICAIDFSAPAGVECEFDVECAPELGFLCLPDPAEPTRKICGGLGPDGTPIPIWEGPACPGEEEGAFSVLFEVDAAGEDFFRLPFPNDIRIDSDGTVDLSGFPRPPLFAVPVDLMTSYVQAIEAEQRGFGPNQTVFFRTSRRPMFCANGCTDSANPNFPCADGCMGQGEPQPTIYAVDLGDSTWPTYAECVAITDQTVCRDTDGCSWRSGACTWTRNFTGYLWQASTGDGRYICGPWIAVTPTFNAAWRVGHTYAVLVHSDVKGADGQAHVHDADFAAMLATTAPGGRLQDAWDAYQPLRDWLCPGGDPPTCTGAPTYTGLSDPRVDQAVTAAHIGGAAVFTVRDPTASLTALGDTVEGLASFTVSDVADCTDATPAATCFDSAGEPFVEIQGRIGLPIFQEGAAPYLTSGGGVDDTSVPSRFEAVRFSLTVPPAAAAALPVVIYAHGTGGDFQSHLADGTAALFAQAANQAAVIGIDQVAHGPRRGTSELDPDVLFFNFLNPQAARGNVLQSAADQLSLAAAIDAIQVAVAAELPAGASLDSSRIAFVGHSQGSTSGVLAMARDSNTGAAVFSGAGGGLLTTLGTKTSPYDLPTIMKLVLADPAMGETWAHPALSLIQGYMEDADPVNYGRHVATTALAGSVPKHVLHVVGIDDTYTPNGTSRHLTRQLRAEVVDDEDTRYVGTSETVTPPVQGNRASGTLTVAGTVHNPAADRDGHFVLFDIAKAAERVETFISEYFANPATPPTVVP